MLHDRLDALAQASFRDELPGGFEVERRDGERRAVEALDVGTAEPDRQDRAELRVARHAAERLGAPVELLGDEDRSAQPPSGGGRSLRRVNTEDDAAGPALVLDTVELDDDR